MNKNVYNQNGNVIEFDIPVYGLVTAIRIDKSFIVVSAEIPPCKIADDIIGWTFSVRVQDYDPRKDNFLIKLGHEYVADKILIYPDLWYHNRTEHGVLLQTTFTEQITSSPYTRVSTIKA